VGWRNSEVGMTRHLAKDSACYTVAMHEFVPTRMRLSYESGAEMG